MPKKQPIKVAIFDAYGTLLDVSSAARHLAQSGSDPRFAEQWMAISALWRNKQLEYTWLRTIAGYHADFWQVTRDGLNYALEAHGFDPDGPLQERLMQLYWELDAYPDALPALTTARAAGLKTGILSNGTQDMLAAAARSGGLSEALDVLLSIDDVGLYKPADQVYEMVLNRFGVTTEEVLFVSSNGWDIAGASGFGFRTLWVNRHGLPVDRLFAEPRRISASLEQFEGFINDV